MYSVRFENGDSYYRMEGNASAGLLELLAALDIPGDVQDASSDDDSILSVSDVSGDWTVTIRAPNATMPALHVTVDGVEHTIESQVTSAYSHPSDPECAKMCVYVWQGSDHMGRVAIDTTDVTHGSEGGGGIFAKGSRHRLIAIPNEGYVFWAGTKGEAGSAAMLLDSVRTPPSIPVKSR